MTSGLFKRPNLGIPTSPVSDLARARASLREHAARSGVTVSTDQPWNRGVGIRFHAAQAKDLGVPLGTGFSDFVELNDDLCVRITDASSSRSIGMKYLAEDWLKLDFWISGKTSLIFNKLGQIDFENRWCFVHLHRGEIAKGEWTGDSERGTGAMIYLTPHFLQETLGDELDRLPRDLRRFASDQAPSTLFEMLPLTPAMAQAVADMVTAPYLGNLRRVFIEAKTMELFSAATQALFNQARDVPPGTIHFTRSECARIHRVRDLIVDQLDDTPRVADLARCAAMNQQKLQQGFKQLYGETIFDFCQKQRLEAARAMLEQRELTVTQIALAVGYEFANNFSTAFKRRYGVSPKAYQKKF